MKGYMDFIVEPLDGRYNSTMSVGDTELILNTELQNHNYVNRIGTVLQVPYFNETEIEIGDLVIVHHNIFRRFRDIRGTEKNSKSYYEEDKYFVQPDQLYGYSKKDSKSKKNIWFACKGFNFVSPLKETKMFTTKFEKPLVGILTIKDKNLIGVEQGDLVGFTPSSEYEFMIGTERVYRVPTNSITIKYEYKGDEEKYNPSWAQSS